MEGFGVMKYTTGETYEGEWRGGIQSKLLQYLDQLLPHHHRNPSILLSIGGKGKITRGFSKYEGNFKEGTKEGQVSNYSLSITATQQILDIIHLII